ncbi:cytochrome P450 [Ilyonectria robusta]|uniref:cytochrome P450 n=1 Tax=Ilyonectria robusta TaxID=1079257 RepID=UPI001E8D233D|nr:cytochrome P450 [Ilyonectria robusta]KAH8654828.1 cytochrome P450 [Ilyonectria robusta]
MSAKEYLQEQAYHYADVGRNRPVLVLGVAISIWVVVKLLFMGRREKGLPPGPPTLPILGNLHQIPLTGLHAKFLQWGEQFGGVFSLKLGSGTMIVLYDRKAIHDLVDKKGVIYAERPKNHVADIVTHGDSFAFMNNTPMYKQQRKIAAHNLSPRVLDENAGHIQDAEISVLMRDLIDDPEDFYHHIMRTTCSVACAMVFGQRGKTYDSFFGRCVYDAMDLYSESLEPGANPPVDEFPFLKYLPDFLSPWRSRAKRSYEAMDLTWAKARELLDKRRSTGERRVCIADKVLDDPKQLVMMTDMQLNHFLGVLVEGGADTTSSSILTMILCLSRHPEYQKMAQKELDALCGNERMPVWSDFAKLPFINCIVKEGLRWHPVLPLGVPHRVAQDDYYEGMLIPKDATVVIPSYAIQRSERYNYEDPEEFKPTRFLNHPRLASDYAGSPDFNNRDEYPKRQLNKIKKLTTPAHHYGYGAGRRICPGMHLAERTQWRAIAKLLWAFDIELPTDPATGNKVIPDPENYKEGIAHGPKPFKVVFKPRSQKHVNLIRGDVLESLKVLQAYE